MDDKEKDFDSAFNDAYDAWFPWIAEAHKDFKYTIDDPWTAADRAKFEDQNREILNFNITRRIVKMITGYERKNRLALKIGPQEGSDEKVTSQLTGLVMPLMENNHGYEVMSDAFELGALITGANLVELYFDRRGDIQFARKPYNKFLLDPHFFKRDLSDCGYIIIHEEGMLISDVKTLLPGKEERVEEYAKMAGGQELPFAAYRGRDDDKRCNYSTFWEQTTKKVKYLANRQSGKQFIWTGKQEELDAVLSQYPLQLTSYDDYKDTVTFSAFINGRCIHKGPDPNGIDDHPFILVSGFWYPEYDDMAKKMQGIVRPTRDPQREVSKRISKILDMIDSQVSTGIDAEENTLVNPDDIHASGQGQGIWFKEGALSAKKVIRRQPPDIPQGLFQLNRDLQGFINDIAGVNDSIFGNEELKAQMSGYLMKLRQGAALVALQDLFDNLRFSKKQLGFKLIKLIQANYKPNKIQRIINESPAPDFYAADLSRYDIVPQEGILTETQRQTAYVEILHLKQMAAGMNEGHVIPWSVVFEMMPMQLKDKFKQLIQQAEQQQTQARAHEAKVRETTEQLKQAKIAADLGRAEERKANVTEHHADAVLARVKAMQEIGKLGLDEQLQLLDRIIALEKNTIQRQAPKQALTKR